MKSLDYFRCFPDSLHHYAGLCGFTLVLHGAWLWAVCQSRAYHDLAHQPSYERYASATRLQMRPMIFQAELYNC